VTQKLKGDHDLIVVFARSAITTGNVHKDEMAFYAAPCRIQRIARGHRLRDAPSSIFAMLHREQRLFAPAGCVPRIA